MQLPAAKLALGRALVHLSRRTATGLLVVETAKGTCRVTVVEGKVCGCEGTFTAFAELQGRVLLEASLRCAPEAQSVAVDGKSKQLQGCLLVLLEQQRVDYGFVEGGRGSLQVSPKDAPRASAIVLLSLRRTAQAADEVAGAALLNRASLSLTALGQAVLSHASLWPEESIMHQSLLEGVAMRRLRALAQNHARVVRLLLALEHFGAFRATDASTGDFTRLLRKHRQLRSNADPFTLLDLPLGATAAQARAALRRLAGELHPDRIGVTVRNLDGISNEVLRGLLHAEVMIRRDRAAR